MTTADNEVFPLNVDGQLVFEKEEKIKSINKGSEKLLLNRPSITAPVELAYATIGSEIVRYGVHTDTIFVSLNALKSLPDDARRNTYILGRLVSPDKWLRLKQDPRYLYHLNSRLRWIDSDGQKFWMRKNGITVPDTVLPVQLFEILPSSLMIPEGVVRSERSAISSPKSWGGTRHGIKRNGWYQCSFQLEA